MDWDAEMSAALDEDGKKLRQLTGEDHGPWRLVDCPACNGSGRHTGFSRTDPDGRDYGPCGECRGAGTYVIDDEPVTLSDLDALDPEASHP